ncbi:methylated-DNA--[protein]-cysteine S-methyltransferase [Paenibacillus mesotrionivorans]|uniref:Methylated-DNA--[protein]-cysteine S-methyltransferase n=1 Tax=Paenibacillus mesotrionivorans TaxID=3160968 RepID=A0ACC7P4U8_9BACL
MRRNLKGTPVYWTRFAYGPWRLHVAATEQGLCYVGSADRSYEELEDWACRRLQGCRLTEDAGKLAPYTGQLTGYLQGERQDFTVPLDLYGTPFQLAVWDALNSIPYGQTVTYSDIAHRLDKPQASRAVGAAIGANPVLITVPCHRVVGKQGALTGYRGGLSMKTGLLELERRGLLSPV